LIHFYCTGLSQQLQALTQQFNLGTPKTEELFASELSQAKKLVMSMYVQQKTLQGTLPHSKWILESDAVCDVSDVELDWRCTTVLAMEY